jgi:hypothetical protein
MEMTVTRLDMMLRQVQQGIVIEETEANARQLSRLGGSLPDFAAGTTVLTGVETLVTSFGQGPAQQQ